MDYGILTLLPIAVVILMALATKRILESLIVGTFTIYIIVDRLGFAGGWMDAFFRAASDRDNQWVLMVCALFGSLIALLGASRGTLGFSKWLGKLCRGPKSSIFITWIMGMLIFVDDYLNIMTLSTCMRKLTDRYKVPRESLSYVIDSTGAPVCALLPFSTWAIFFAGLFYAEAGIPELGYGSAINTFCHIIPYVFYAIAAVLLVPLLGLGLLPKWGKMRAAYQRTERTGQVYSPASVDLNTDDDEEEDTADNKSSILDFIVPIITLIALTLVTGELFLALIAAIASCFLLYIPRKKMTATHFCDLAMHGFCSMIPTVAIIFFVFVMQQGMSDIGIANYVVTAVRPFISASLLPVITFVIVAALNFSTGSAWGVPAIVSPILLPLALSIGANPLLVMGAIVSGATLGSHACFYSDATVLTSSCCKLNNMDHALSQLPYAMLAAGISAGAYLAFGYLL